MSTFFDTDFIHLSSFLIGIDKIHAGRIQPNDRTIIIKNVNDTNECIFEINKIKKI